MHVLAPAKINLHLRVGPPRQDGFHPLLSWMVTVGLFDTLSIERALAASDTLSCDDPALAVDNTNLVLRAVALLRQEIEARGSGAPDAARTVPKDDPVGKVKISLAKRIPTGSGLGGGSSDGARTLVALDRLWSTGLGAERLSALAARLGSDLPFFIEGRSAICAGRGERVVPIAPPAPKAVVLVLPGFHLSTPAVYREFDRQQLGCRSSLEPDAIDWGQWQSLRAEALLQQLVNDLEPAAFALEPQLGKMRTLAERLLGRTVRMSGSGSALFTLYDTLEEATAAIIVLREALRVRMEAVPVAPQYEED